MQIRVGDKVGDYQIVEPVGAGAVGRVFKVRHLLTQRIEALKILSEWVAKDDPRTQRFLREIQVQAGLNHPNIATVHNAFWWRGRLVMVMEFVEGDPLHKLLDSGVIPLPKALDYIDQALLGISHAHAHGVVHRDVKPANLIITAGGTVKVTDFGLAKRFQQPGLTETGDIMGSVYYMSPEQVRAEDLDTRSDLYSLGVLLYELAAGRRPFESDQSFAVMEAHVNDKPIPPGRINPSIPAPLEKIILHSLEKSPQDRFQSADEFRSAVGAVRQDLEEEIDSETDHAQLIPTPKSYVIGAAASLAIVILTFFYLTSQQSPERVEPSTPLASLEESPEVPTYRPDLSDAPSVPPVRESGSANQPMGPVAPAEAPASPEATEPAVPPEPSTAAPPQRQTESTAASSASKAPGPEPPREQPKPSPLKKPSAPQTPAAAAEARSYRLLQSLQEPGNIGAVALSPDGKWVAASTSDNSIRVWDIATGKSLAVLKGHSGRVVSLSVGPEGRLASGSWDGSAKVWELRTESPIRTFSHNSEVTAVVLSPGGAKLAVGLQDKTIRIWDLQVVGGSEKLRGHQRPSQAIALSPNEKWLASVSVEKGVQLWRLAPAEKRYELRGLDTGATAVSFSLDGRRIAAAGSGRARVWDVQTREEVLNLGAPGWLHKLIPASDGSFFLLGATRESLGLWDVDESRKVCEIRPKGATFSIALAAGGRRFASATDTGLISIWETTQ